MKIITSFTIVLLLTLSIHSISISAEPPTQAPTQEQPDDVNVTVTETVAVVVETIKTEVPADRIDVPAATTDVKGKVPALPSNTYMK